MPEQLLCPGGIESQTGSAASKRYPGANIIDTVIIEEVKNIIADSVSPFCLPIWNSHVGEIPKSNYIWDYLVDEKIKVLDLWAQEIEFWHIRRKGQTATYNKVGSVSVVASQCAAYLAKLGIPFDGSFKLSSDALTAYRNGAELDGVFIAPMDEAQISEFDIISRGTTEPRNFTSFVKIISVDHVKSQGSPVNYLSGLEIRPLIPTIGESEKEFFDNIFRNINSLDDIPRLLFVLDRGAKVGLIFQSNNQLYLEEILDVPTLEREEITLYNEAGSTEQKYTDQLATLLESKFPELLAYDFIVHTGNNTCIFICSTLGIFTHGYDRTTVEPVIRFYISNMFEAINSGIACTEKQRTFFEEHKQRWLANRAEFIDFKEVA